MKTSQKFLFVDTFNPSAPLRVDSIRIEWLLDECPDLSHLTQDYAGTPRHEAEKYMEQDARRFQAFNDGQWHMSGCRAVAEVSYPIGNGSRRLERFTSGGLWGIESDSDAAHKAEIESEQIKELQAHLAQFNVPAQFPIAA